MIIYFTDRKINILGMASTSLPNGLRIYDDLTVEDVSSGVNTFSCSIDANDQDRQVLEDAVKEGHYILKNSGDAFSDTENTYDSLYQIVETQFNNETETMYLYAEDAGLELLGKVVPGITLENKTLVQMIQQFVPSDWNIKTIDIPTGTKTHTWEGENTAIERIKSIADLFECEVYYSFDIERLQVQGKNINVVNKRGSQKPVAQLKMNYDIDKIITKKSIVNMATAYTVTGGTPEGKDTPINLKGYAYSYTDEKGDVYQVDTATGQMRNTTQMQYWGSSLNTNGLIVKSFNFDTTDKAILAGQARAALQKVCYPEVNYEVNVINYPEGVRIGDRVNIIDDDGNLYLESRILKLEISAANDKIVATFGDFLIKSAGISSMIEQYASEFISNIKNGQDATTVGLISSGGNVFHNQPIATTIYATVFKGNVAITKQEDLEEIYGSNAQLLWYNNDGSILLGTGFSYELNSDLSAVSVICKLSTQGE